MNLNHPALPAIEGTIRSATGNTFRIDQISASGSGTPCTFTVTGADQRYFIKLGDLTCAPLFAAEAEGLAAIAACGAFRTPDLIACTRDDTHAFLVFEHLDLHAVQSATEGERFAEALAALHQTEGNEFGWPHDNFIGNTPQRNTAQANWSLFVVEQRLRPQFEQARSKGFSAELSRQAERLYERIPALFLDYRPRPSLLHGDLWHGNAGALSDGTPVIYDPAVHYGDRESDIAMSELFGGFPTAFYARYRSLLPLHPDYEQRKLLYCLYHMLNHLNLFGRGYLGETLRLATRLNESLSRRGT